MLRIATIAMWGVVRQFGEGTIRGRHDKGDLKGMWHSCPTVLSYSWTTKTCHQCYIIINPIANHRCHHGLQNYYAQCVVQSSSDHCLLLACHVATTMTSTDIVCPSSLECTLPVAQVYYPSFYGWTLFTGGDRLHWWTCQPPAQHVDRDLWALIFEHVRFGCWHSLRHTLTTCTVIYVISRFVVCILCADVSLTNDPR